MTRPFLAALGATVAVAVAATAPSHGAPNGKLRIAPLTKQDFKQVPGGGAVWFSKGRKYYFHVPMDQPGYARVDGRLVKLVRQTPRGTSWACQPMVFVDKKNGLTMRASGGKANWRLHFKMGGRQATVRGLRCGIGD